ncbi:energy transducer TonB [uncultured Cytophaga sp.]|uniref:energy transducer TonB n=1 Tax=uncultured Cytophaga sp. TaxID=160238 RepID=UPI002616E852|nr:energy transducer TonB [uncultured Cytophaga sp.]
MEKDLDLSKATLDEIVFEDRNKSYGGYFLRVWYDKNVTKAVIVTCTAFLILAACINFYYKISAKPEEVFVPVEIQMDMVEEPLKAEEIEKLPPPPPKIQEVKVEEMKYLPPVIKPDKKVTKDEQLKELDSLLTSNPSDKDVDGKKGKKIDFDEGQEGGKLGGDGIKKTEVISGYLAEMPKFKGTSTKEESALEVEKYIQRKMIYPEDAKQRKVTGVVYVSYVITETGKVTNVEVIKGRGIDPSCDAEAVRVIKSMPDFTPGNQNGETKKVRITQRIKFTLN